MKHIQQCRYSASEKTVYPTFLDTKLFFHETFSLTTIFSIMRTCDLCPFISTVSISRLISTQFYSFARHLILLLSTNVSWSCQCFIYVPCFLTSLSGVLESFYFFLFMLLNCKLVFDHPDPSKVSIRVGVLLTVIIIWTCIKKIFLSDICAGYEGFKGVLEHAVYAIWKKKEKGIMAMETA